MPIHESLVNVRGWIDKIRINASLMMVDMCKRIALIYMGPKRASSKKSHKLEDYYGNFHTLNER